MYGLTFAVVLRMWPYTDNVLSLATGQARYVKRAMCCCSTGCLLVKNESWMKHCEEWCEWQALVDFALLLIPCPHLSRNPDVLRFAAGGMLLSGVCVHIIVIKLCGDFHCCNG